MPQNIFYPGKILRNMSFVGSSEGADGYIFEFQNEDGQKKQVYLSEAHCDLKKKLNKGENVPGPFVILKKIGPIYEVAQTNYHPELRDLFCLELQDIPWRELWDSAFSSETLKPTGQTRNAYGKKWEVRLPSAVVPITGSYHLNFMKGKHFLYPVDMNFMYRHNAVYRPQADDVEWPARFECEFQIDQPTGRTVRKAKILLHGPVEPLKLHFNIWKHLAEDERVDSEPGSRMYWNKWSDTQIPEDFVKCFGDECRPNIKKDRNGKDVKVRCHSGCSKHNFENVNQKLLAFNNAYLSEAVTFFRNNTTLPNRSSHITIKEDGKTVDFRVNCDEIQQEQNMFVRLHLRGQSFNWNKWEPLIHLHILTFFVGPNEHKNKSAKRSENTLYGQILKIKEIN